VFVHYLIFNPDESKGQILIVIFIDGPKTLKSLLSAILRQGGQ